MKECPRSVGSVRAASAAEPAPNASLAPVVVAVRDAATSAWTHASATLLSPAKPLSALELSRASFKRATLLGDSSSAMLPRVVSRAEFYER